MENNDLIGKKHKRTCTNLKCFESSFLFISVVAGYLYIYGFASLVGIPIKITSSATEFSITAGIRKYK